MIRIPSPEATAVVPLDVPPSIKLISAAVDVTAVLPKVNCPSGTISPAAPLKIKSSADVSQVRLADAVSP